MADRELTIQAPRPPRLSRRAMIHPQRYAMLLEQQRGSCAACGQPETTTDEAGYLVPLEVYWLQREERTVVGLICQSCDSGFRGFRHSASIMARALAMIAGGGEPLRTVAHAAGVQR